MWIFLKIENIRRCRESQEGRGRRTRTAAERNRKSRLQKDSLRSSTRLIDIDNKVLSSAAKQPQHYDTTTVTLGWVFEKTMRSISFVRFEWAPTLIQRDRKQRKMKGIYSQSVVLKDRTTSFFRVWSGQVCSTIEGSVWCRLSAGMRNNTKNVVRNEEWKQNKIWKMLQLLNA